MLLDLAEAESSPISKSKKSAILYVRIFNTDIVDLLIS